VGPLVARGQPSGWSAYNLLPASARASTTDIIRRSLRHRLLPSCRQQAARYITRSPGLSGATTTCIPSSQPHLQYLFLPSPHNTNASLPANNLIAMGSIVSAIAACFDGIISAIGAFLMAIVNGIAIVLESIIYCIEFIICCGCCRSGYRSRSTRRGGFGRRRRAVGTY